MKVNHNFFSNLAFNLAEKNLGKTKHNPSVGCVIEKNGTVISSGITSLDGRPHAEFNALNQKTNFKGSTMYVTLEPCAHYGKTPPCVKIIKKKKIKKVYYCFEDPDKRTFLKAKKILKNRITKIKQVDPIYRNFYKSYVINKKRKIPLLDAKIAISKDFFSINKKKSKWITNKRSRLIGHLIRSKYDCIISTSASINKDNSLLNCRIHGLNNNKPDLIIIDRYLRLKRNLRLFRISKSRKTYIVTSSNDKKKIAFFTKNNLKIIKIKELENKKDFSNLFKKIFLLGKRRILIESGLIFLNRLLKFNYINDLFIFKSNEKLRRNGQNNASINYLKNLNFGKNINVNLNDDKLYKVRIN